MRFLRLLGAVWALSAAALARADLTGVTVNGRLEAAAAGWEQSSAAVGPGVEFTGALASGMVQAALDISGTTLTFSLVNRWSGNELDPDGIVALGLRGLRLDGLVSARGPVTQLAPLSSTFPAGAFDRLSVTPGRVVWIAPELIMPGRGTRWEATWEFVY